MKEHPDNCNWYQDWHRCNCGLFDAQIKESKEDKNIQKVPVKSVDETDLLLKEVAFQKEERQRLIKKLEKIEQETLSAFYIQKEDQKAWNDFLHRILFLAK
jgi:hypothetical protein